MKSDAAPSARRRRVSASKGSSAPRIGLALGGGGARGIAHVVALEALDELGLRPSIVAGTSIGAVIGAAYCSGLTPREIRAHVEETLAARFSLIRDLVASRARTLPRTAGFFGPVTALFSPETLLDTVYPSRVARRFEDLEIPLKVVATDFYGLEPAIFSAEVPLRRAVAASMALPALFEPVMVDGRALVDGGLVNPLPFDLLSGEADVTIAIDVSGAPTPAADRAHPTAAEALLGAPAVFERSIVREKLRAARPDIYIDARVGQFQLIDIWRSREILAAAEPIRERLKAGLARIIGAETLPVADAARAALEGPHEPLAATEAPGRPILTRIKSLRARRRDRT